MSGMRKPNVHLRVSDGVVEYCREVNGAVRAVARSPIVFGRGSSATPHVSLIMGVLDPARGVDDLLGRVAEIAERSEPVEIEIREPVLDTTWGGYVLCYLDVGERFVEIQDRMFDTLAHSLLVPDEHHFRVPHLTLAYVEERHAEVERVLSSTNRGPSFTATRVGVADAGPKGTCVNALGAFPLGGAA